MKVEHAEENLYFFEAAENLKMMESVDYSDAGPDADFFEGWRKIMKRHIDPGCPEEVNIPQLLAKKLLDMQSGAIPNVNRRAVTKELEKAEKEVVGMIAGVFPRFQTSNIFKEYIRPASRKVSTVSLRNAGEQKLTSANMTTLSSSILLCEKHELTGIILATILASKGYNVTVVGDGDLALEKLKELTFDFVLVNYELPKKNAEEVITAHKTMSVSKNAKAKFICMLPDGSKKYRKNALTAGYHVTLVKPFSMEDFEKAKAAAGGSISKLMVGLQGMMD